MNKTVIGVLIALMLCMPFVAAQDTRDWTGTPPWVLRAQERNNASNGQHLQHNGGWTHNPLVPCVVKENAYPNGTVYHQIWGILGKLSNGGTLCYVPSRGGGGGGHSTPEAKPPAPEPEEPGCWEEEFCWTGLECDWEENCEWKTKRVCFGRGRWRQCHDVPYLDCDWERVCEPVEKCRTRTVCEDDEPQCPHHHCGEPT